MKRRHRRVSALERLERRMLLSLSAVGGEFRANTFTLNSQSLPDVAADADGDFVVAWSGQGEGETGFGIFAQRYNAAGVPQGSEFRVNTFTTGNQGSVAVAMDADGDFVITWTSNGQDGGGLGVYAQRYSAAGVPQGGEFRVNATTSGSQNSPSVAMNAGGDFVVTWSGNGPGDSQGVFAQRYNAAGVPQGGETLVNTFTTGLQATQSGSQSVAMDASGNYVITWVSFEQDGSNSGVYGQRFSSSGVPQGDEFRANTYTTSDQTLPSAALAANGDFVIVWQSLNQDGSNYGVYAQRYNAAGVPQGTEFPANTFTTNAQRRPAVAMDATGGFLITWQSDDPFGPSLGVFGQSFSAAGVAQGDEFRANTFSNGLQRDPAVALDAAGDAVIAWDSGNQDGSSYGVYAQRYAESNPDTAPPMAGGVFVEGRRVTPYTVHASSLSQIVVSFSEGMTDAGGTAGPNSVTNPANWLVTRDGVGVTPTITYGFNPAANRFEAVLNLPQPFGDGNFLVKARDNLRDIAGNRLDGNVDGTAGVSFVMPFSVGAAARGTEFRVNTFTTGSQTSPDVAINDAGEIVVAWSSNEQDGSGFGVYGQGYSANGVANGGEYRSNTTTVGSQFGPKLAIGTNVPLPPTVWYGNGPGDDAGVFRNGILSSDVRVNTYTTNTQRDPVVAMDALGDHVVAWVSRLQDGSEEGIYAQRFNVGGQGVGAEFRVNQFTTGPQVGPSVAMDADGDFVVAWYSTETDASWNIFARRYNSAGTPQGDEFRVNTFTTGTQGSPDVAMDADGDFVVVWYGQGPDSSTYDIYAQRYNAAGTPQGGEFRVNTFTTSRQWLPAVAMDANGHFIVTWESDVQDGFAEGVYAQRFSAAGVPLGGEFRVNTHTTGRQEIPAVAMNGTGDFVITWSSENQDGSQSGIYAQRYGRRNPPALTTLAGNPDPVIAGNSITLSAGGVNAPDGSITSVSFYRETNGLPGLQVGVEGDTFVGTDTTVDAGFWSINLSTAALGAGTYTYWAQATDDVGLIGPPASTTNSVTDGSPAPTVTASNFLFETAPQRLSFVFNQNVGASLGVNDIVVQTLPSGPTVNPTGVSYNAGTNTATFSFTGIIPDGNFRATLLASGITNSGGTPMAANHVFNFFVLAGDANRDRKVDVADLGILASNWQALPRTFSQGDFDYSGTVDVNDLGILATKWQQSLVEPGPAGATTVRGRAWPRIATQVLA